MDFLEALSKLPNLVAMLEHTSLRLIEAEKELAAIKEDKYVTYGWVCEFLGVTKNTAMQMLQDEKIFTYGRKIKRFRRSDIIRFAERNSIEVKYIK